EMSFQRLVRNLTLTRPSATLSTTYLQGNDFVEMRGTLATNRLRHNPVSEARDTRSSGSLDTNPIKAPRHRGMPFDVPPRRPGSNPYRMRGCWLWLDPPPNAGFSHGVQCQYHCDDFMLSACPSRKPTSLLRACRMLGPPQLEASGEITM